MGIWTPLPHDLFRITGMHSWHTDTASDLRLTGTDYVVINAVGDPAAGNGTFHGTFNVVNGGGSWSGTWVGKEVNGLFYIDGLLHGSGGYDGLVANWSYRPNLDDPEGCSLISGYIVETVAGH